MKRGFTLIELVVVLAVLAVVTHLAVREMSHLRDDRLRQVADRQLADIRDAVWRARPGEEPAGFVVDMGRLPRASVRTNGEETLSVTIDELWRRPAGGRPYTLLPATVANLVGPQTNELADAEVLVGCGWRGPYVRLPSGADRFTDAWGNRMENRDDAGYDRLLGASGGAAAAGDDVWGLRHFGSDGRSDADVPPADASCRDAEVRFLPVGGTTNTLAVAASFVDGASPRPVDGTVRFRWYAPCGGAITGAVATVVLEGASLATCRFEAVPPGVATLVVQVGNRKCAQERIVVPPGGRAVSMKVLVP